MPDSSLSALSGRTFVAGFGFDHTPEEAEGEWPGGPSPLPLMWAVDALFLCGG